MKRKRPSSSPQPKKPEQVAYEEALSKYTAECMNNALQHLPPEKFFETGDEAILVNKMHELGLPQAWIDWANTLEAFKDVCYEKRRKRALEECTKKMDHAAATGDDEYREWLEEKVKYYQSLSPSNRATRSRALADILKQRNIYAQKIYDDHVRSMSPSLLKKVKETYEKLDKAELAALRLVFPVGLAEEIHKLTRRPFLNVGRVQMGGSKNRKRTRRAKK